MDRAPSTKERLKLPNHSLWYNKSLGSNPLLPEQYPPTPNPRQQISLPLCTHPHLPRIPHLSVEPIAPVTRDKTRKHTQPLRLLDPPVQQLFGESLALVIRMHAEEFQVQVISLGSGPVT